MELTYLILVSIMYGLRVSTEWKLSLVVLSVFASFVL